MGAKGYSDEIRLKAKAMSLIGNLTDVQIAEQLGIARVNTIGVWRKQDSWERESKIIAQVAEEKVARAVGESIAEMNTRHLKECQLLQTKGVQALRQLAPSKATEAAAMVESGLRTERLVRGEPTEILATQAMMKANVQILEGVVAQVLKAQLDSGEIDAGIARSFADKFANLINKTDFCYKIKS